MILENEYQTENQSVYSQNKTMIKGFLVCLLVLRTFNSDSVHIKFNRRTTRKQEKVITEIWISGVENRQFMVLLSKLLTWKM